MSVTKAYVRVLAGGLVLGLSALLASACGSDEGGGSDSNNTCSLGGQKCALGCSAIYGCVECIGDAECGAGAPYCVVGQCVQCSANAQCGAGQACYPREHECKAACATNSDCPGEAPLCDPTGTCVGCTENSDCPADKPICDPVSRQCGDCSVNDHCGATEPICNQQEGKCEECLIDIHCSNGQLCGTDHKCHNACSSDADCADDGKPHCNIEKNECVECLASTDCPDPTAPICADNKHCVGCVTSADCGDLTAPVCDGGECVQCKDDGDCIDPAMPKCKGNVCSAP